MAVRPRIFIGSSVEGRGIAELVQYGLEACAECVRWSQGVVGVSDSTLESLLEVARDFDFAVIVLTPDDLDPEPIKGRHSPRDNILFELGFFVGALGRGRTFVVHAKDPDVSAALSFPGVASAAYVQRGQGDLKEALAQPVSLIKASINVAHRPRSEPPSGSVSETMTRMSSELSAMSTDLAKQTARLRRKIDSVMPPASSSSSKRADTERPKKG